MTILDARESKLPKWATDTLAALRNEIADKDRQLAISRRQATDNGATGVVIADCLGGDGFPLNDRALIDFKLPGGKITVMLRDGSTILDLNSSGSMLILPRASNSAYIQVRS